METEISDPTRYNYEDIKKATEGKYSSRQLDQTLSELGCSEGAFPDNGINDEGFRKLRDRLSEIDDAESKLEEVKQKKRKKRKDLVSTIEQTKEEYWGGALSVIGKDLGIVGKGLWKTTKTLTYISGWFFAIPTTLRRASEKDKYGDKDYGAFCGTFLLGLASAMYYLVDSLYVGHAERAIAILSAQVGANLANGMYEYARHVKKRAKENK